MSDEQNEIDAQRYRWLRKNFNRLIVFNGHHGSIVYIRSIQISEKGLCSLSELSVDRAVDKAIELERKQ